MILLQPEGGRAQPVLVGSDRAEPTNPSQKAGGYVEFPLCLEKRTGDLLTLWWSLSIILLPTELGSFRSHWCCSL